MYLDISENELQQFVEEIGTIMGAFTIDVDITKEEVLILLRRSMLGFQKQTSIWQLQNQFGNLYGQPAGILQQQQIATMNFSLAQQVTDWFASMSRAGGKIPWHKDYILLEPGRQIYDLSKESSKPYPPGSRRIHRVMWCAKPEILNLTRFSSENQNGDDVLYSSNWSFTAGGLNFGNSPLQYLGYSFDTIMMMQSMEMRNKILFSEFFHNLSGDILEITPQPGSGVTATPPGMKLFYYYWAESETVLNGKDLSISESSMVSSTLGGAGGVPAGESNLIANPLDMKIGYIMWSSLSPWAKSWVFDYTLAYCKYVIGSKLRKIKKTFTSGEMDYDIEFDYQSLLNESQDEMNKLNESLKSDLETISVSKMMADKAEIASNAGKIMQNTTRLWTFM